MNMYSVTTSFEIIAIWKSQNASIYTWFYKRVMFNCRWGHTTHIVCGYILIQNVFVLILSIKQGHIHFYTRFVIDIKVPLLFLI